MNDEETRAVARLAVKILAAPDEFGSLAAFLAKAVLRLIEDRGALEQLLAQEGL